MRMFRRHSSWYTKGFRGSTKLRARLMRITRLHELEEILRASNPSEPFPPEAIRVSRGKTAGRQKVSLPQGFLENRLVDDTPPVHIETPALAGG